MTLPPTEETTAPRLPTDGTGASHRTFARLAKLPPAGEEVPWTPPPSDKPTPTLGASRPSLLGASEIVRMFYGILLVTMASWCRGAMDHAASSPGALPTTSTPQPPAERRLATGQRLVGDLVESGSRLFWMSASPQGRAVQSMAKAGDAIVEVVPPTKDLRAFAVEGAGLLIASGSVIQRVVGGKTTLVANRKTEMLAVDEDNLYWATPTTPTTMKIESMPRKGGAPVVLVPSTRPVLALGVDRTHIVWSVQQSATEYVLSRIPLKGGPIQVLVRQPTPLVWRSARSGVVWSTGASPAQLTRVTGPGPEVRLQPLPGPPTALTLGESGAVFTVRLENPSGAVIERLGPAADSYAFLREARSGVRSLVSDPTHLYGFSCGTCPDEAEGDIFSVPLEPSSSPVTSSAVMSARPATSVPVGMVQVRAGSFRMGAEGEGRSERPVHEVRITRDFFLDTTEVTVSSYLACEQAGKCSPTRVHGDAVTGAEVEKYGKWCNEGRPERVAHPINCIDREQAATYCQWAGKRLPTEAEWEFAARAVDGRLYVWGAEPPSCAFGNFSGVGTQRCRPDGGTQPVGSFPAGASTLGALDMAGNVWEWVDDGWDPGAYTVGARVDPVVPVRSSQGVLRGGSWDFVATSAKTTTRLPYDRGRGHVSTGVRCAKTAPPG